MGWAIDPDETREVEVDGATFTIGHIPMGIFRRLILEDTRNQDDAKRRAIRDLGTGASEDEITRRALSDPEYIERSDQLALEHLRWSVRGHRGLCYADGRDAPFELEPAKHQSLVGGSAPAVTPRTLRVYAQSFSRLVHPLLLAVMEFNTVTEREKKVSQSPPRATEGGSLAASA